MISKFKINIVLIFFFFLSANSLFAQLPVGTWREHLPYNKVIMVAETPTRIYAATPFGLFYMDYSDFSINRLSKVNGLSDVGVTAIEYNSDQRTLVVCYKNANVDLIKDDVVFNLSDIKRNSIPASKRINRIKSDGNFAYLACGFGVVVIDVKRKEIKETWLVGNESTYRNISDIEMYKDSIFLATDYGIQKAKKSSANLANYQVWTADTSFCMSNNVIFDIEKVGDKLLAHQSFGDSSYLFVYNGISWNPITLANNRKKNSLEVTYNKLVTTSDIGNVVMYDTNFNEIGSFFTYSPGYIDATFARFDRKGDVWVCDRNNGLVWVNGSNTWDCFKHSVMGPNIYDIWKVFGINDKMIILTGAVDDTYSNLWGLPQFSRFSDEQWVGINQYNNPKLDSLFDIVCGVIDPLNTNSAWLGSWGRGLIHLEGNQVTDVFNSENSALESNSIGFANVGGVAMDKDKNLWIANPGGLKTLKVKTPNNQWYSYSMSPFNSYVVSQIAIDSNGYKWLLLPRNNGILVYNDNGTLANPNDDQVKLLNINLGTNVSTNFINGFVQDLNGDMWVATDKGIKVFYNISNIFSTANPAPQNILVEQDGYVQNLFEFENVTAIVVDGANRKWVGTFKAGLFLISADGTTELAHFTASNSPLFSDEITSLSMNQANGELFIGTTTGLMSYRTNATLGREEIVKSEVLAFPNPIRPDYNGEIVINGLTTNANIKITNSNGGLVYQTIANGGTAIWNGKNFNNEKVATGVYLVFSSDETGDERIVTKLLFIK